MAFQSDIGSNISSVLTYNWPDRATAGAFFICILLLSVSGPHERTMVLSLGIFAFVMFFGVAFALGRRGGRRKKHRRR